MNTHACWRSLLLLGFVALASRADWNEGQTFKMHWPQLPDPTGWDIDVSHYTLADDWQCTETGPVKQVHFWISWTNDVVGVITNVHLSIHDNFPGPPYSQPAELIWQDNFGPGQFKMRPYSSGLQGWYDPISNIWRRPDHMMIFQLNRSSTGESSANVLCDWEFAQFRFPLTVYNQAAGTLRSAAASRSYDCARTTFHSLCERHGRCGR